MKAHERAVVNLQSFLTSALDGCKWLTTRSSRFSPGEKALKIQWTQNVRASRMKTTVTLRSRKKQNPGCENRGHFIYRGIAASVYFKKSY